MTDVIVSRIQNRRGLRQDLPQPLDPGEFGYCTDTGQLFIGADSTDGEGYASAVIECYTPSTGSNNDANLIGETQIVQISWLDEEEFPSEQTAKDAAIADITAAETTIVSDYQDITVNEVTTIDEDTGLEVIVYTVKSAFLGYLVAPASAPGLALGDERFFTDNALLPSNKFVQATLALDGAEYSVEDSYAIANVINSVFGAPGLVTVLQNIEVITDATSISDLLSNDITMKSTFININPTQTTAPQTIGELSYDYEYSDSFVIEYSISNGDVDPNVDNHYKYSRTGSLQITAGLTEEGAKIAQVTDSATETDFTTYLFDLSFQAVVNEVDGVDLIQIQSITRTTDAPINMILSTNARRWKSYPVGDTGALPTPGVRTIAATGFVGPYYGSPEIGLADRSLKATEKYKRFATLRDLAKYLPSVRDLDYEDVQFTLAFDPADLDTNEPMTCSFTDRYGAVQECDEFESPDSEMEFTHPGRGGSLLVGKLGLYWQDAIDYTDINATYLLVLEGVDTNGAPVTINQTFQVETDVRWEKHYYAHNDPDTVATLAVVSVVDDSVAEEAVITVDYTGIRTTSPTITTFNYLAEDQEFYDSNTLDLGVAPDGQVEVRSSYEYFTEDVGTMNVVIYSDDELGHHVAIELEVPYERPQ